MSARKTQPKLTVVPNRSNQSPADRQGPTPRECLKELQAFVDVELGVGIAALDSVLMNEDAAIEGHEYTLLRATHQALSASHSTVQTLIAQVKAAIEAEVTYA